MKIGVLGPAGTFSDFAAREFFQGLPESNAEFVLYPSIAAIIEGADAGHCDKAFVPIENSIEGAVNTTMDSLASGTRLLIEDEYTLGIHECLMAASDGPLTEIISHPQPLGQCANYLKKHPDLKITVADSTAQGASFAASHPGVGVIGGKALSKIYHLSILAENIEDNHANSTRFVLLSKEQHPRTGKDKTSFIFSIVDRPGELIKLLSVLDIFDINMSKIESRPMKTTLGQYLFFVDVVGHMEDENVKDAVDVLKKKTTWFKLLGSYPSLNA